MSTKPIKNLLTTMIVCAVVFEKDSAFYPSLCRPAERILDVWTTRMLTYHGREITVQNKLTVSGDIEEQIQIHRYHE